MFRLSDSVWGRFFRAFPFRPESHVKPTPSQPIRTDKTWGCLTVINGNFAVIRGALGPRSFFENLRSLDSPNCTVFLHEGTEVQFFPERVTITVSIMGPYRPEYRKDNPKSFDAKYMEELKFRADWKRGADLRPVTSFRPLKPPSPQPWEVPFLPECWVYEFVVEDREVPISDQLIFYVLSPMNERLERSGYLNDEGVRFCF